MYNIKNFMFVNINIIIGLGIWVLLKMFELFERIWRKNLFRKIVLIYILNISGFYLYICIMYVM